MRIQTLTTSALLMLCSLGMSSYSYAKSGHEHKDGHALVQDAYKAGTDVEFEEDQDDVYRAVQAGLIQPFSALYSTVENELNGRIIKVELEEDDDEWVYELKLIHESNVIKVEYDAKTLEMLEIKGRNLMNVIKAPQ